MVESGNMVLEKCAWDHMTEDQLIIRLAKITNRMKLNCFIYVASTESIFLERLGYNKWDELFKNSHPLQKGSMARWNLRCAKIKKEIKIIYEPEFRMIR